jgi:outer membrane cobalamin receptor
MQAGLRAELTDIEARLIKSNVNNDQYYFSLFPSSTVSYEIAKDNQVQLSYSRRLSRPYFRSLLPFSNFNDPRNNRFGNPALRPEFTNSFELGYLTYLEKGTFLSSIYYRNTTGVVEEITTASDDGTTIRTPVNLAERNAYGLEMNYTANPLEWLDVTSDLNFFRALVNGQYQGRDFNSDTFSWSGRITSKFTLKNRLKAQFSYDYDAPVNTTQGRRLSVSAFDLAASKDVFSNKGTFTIACRDLFNTRIRRSIIDLPELQAESSFQWRQARSVVVSFNYRLGQDKKNSYDVGRN